ncbi:MAG: cytochrome c4 [Pseudomonadota bacterium]|nr:cytochrome c4 [Pseudomonadota bacterium]
MKSLLTQILTLFTAAVAVPLAAAAAEPPAAPAFKYDAAKAQQLATSCGACHTQDGSRGVPTNPILLRQHPGYLVKQLTEFKAGVRKNAIMMGMAATLSPDDMKQVATFYGTGKAAKPGFAKDKDTVVLGEQIYRGGIFERAVPACAGCHSPTGAGIPVQYPRLAGQHAEYLQTQLMNFRSGARANNAQMMTIAGKLKDDEIKAVADYLEGLRPAAPEAAKGL